MNNSIRLVRYYRTLRWLLPYESRKLRNLFLAATAFFAWYQTYALYYNIVKYASMDSPFAAGIMQHAVQKTAGINLLFLAVFMCLGATFAFSTLHRRHAGRQLLLLPASNAEKFAALWVLYVPLLLVLLVLAFIAGDLLRMLVLPLIVENGSLPSAIPIFFHWMGGWMLLNDAMQNAGTFVPLTWALIIVIHALCLLSSVVAGYVGWLLSGLTVFGCAYLFIENYGHDSWHAHLLFTFALLFVLTAYWLFRRFPLFKSLFTLRFYGI